MYNNPKQISDALLDAMQIISDKNISKTEYGTTIQGNIIECKDPSVGKYLVKYQDSILEAYSTSPNVQYPKGMSVYLFTTNGKLGEMKIILGSTKQLGSNYIEEYMGQEYYDTSNNFIKNDDYIIELCSYIPKNMDIKEEVIYEKDKENNKIEFSDNIIQKLQNSNYLKISGTIETNLSYKQKCAGRYGICITLLIKNSATGNIEEQDYYFDSNNFNGNPYEYRVPSTQSVSYPIDSINFIAVSRITTFVQGFPNKLQNEEEVPAADIFISNLTLNGSYRLSETEKSTVGVILTAPRGYIFNGDEDEYPVRPIKANLRIKMKQVDLEAQGAQVYWFKEDLNVNTISSDYLRLGGLGWKCINAKSAVDSNTYQFNPSSTIDINKEDVKFNKENKFKCVIRYDNKSYTKEFIIFNNGASYQITLESTAGTSFSCSAGHPNLICKIWKTQNEEKQDITEKENEDGDKVFTFKWQVCNSQNVTKRLKEDSDAEKIYQENKNDLEKINKILNGTQEEPSFYKDDLKNKLEIEGTTINEEELSIPYEKFIEVLQERINRYESKQRIVKNILYNVDLHQVIDFSVFKCSCYEGDTCYGTANIIIKNTQIPNDGYVLAINNGDQVFLYNEEGTSLHSAGLDQPYSIRNLSFTLFHNGEEINQDDLQNGVIAIWKVPLKNTMLEIGSNKNSSDEDYKYIIGKTLPIDVSNVYNSSFSNNDIYLILQYKDLVLTTKTNFGFSKQGELGTNGTKYQFKITTDTPILRYNVYREQGRERQGWEKERITLIPELWCNGQKQSEISDIINWNILKNNLNKDKEWNYFPSTVGINDGQNRIVTLDDVGILNVPDVNLVNIIQATLTGPEGYKYYSVLPFVSIYEYFDNTKYQVQFNLNSGFRTVVYKNDGTQPKYDNRLPFEVNIYKKFGTEKENVTLQKKENFTFKWEVTDTEDLTGLETDSINKYVVIPTSVLKNGNRVTDGILLYITKDENPFAYVHIPIYLMLNRYENAAMNDWDGTSIEINEDGYILTPQVGAGTKDTDNRFTGVLLGTERVRTQNNEIKDNVGLLGYAAGARSIFLDAETGNAEFGLPDKGQIKIDVQDQAIIKSGDYDETKLTGMEIQFSNPPHIKFGSGKFNVNSEGHIHAAGGGDIAGWQLDNDALYKGKVRISSNNSDPFNKAIQVTNENDKDIFSVDYRGFLHSQQGDIAGWIIQPNKLYNGDVGLAPNNWICGEKEVYNKEKETSQKKSVYTGVFWAGGPEGEEVINFSGVLFAKRSFFVTRTGFLYSKAGNIGGWNIEENKLSYSTGGVEDKVGLSATGVKIGNQESTLIWAKNTSGTRIFSVSSNGYMYAKNGEIGNWKFGNNGLYSKGGDTKFKKEGSGVYVGSDGIRLGSNFYVEPSGNIYSISGSIGGCTISDDGISGTGWYVKGGGKAKFTNVEINGASVTNMMTASKSGGLTSAAGGGGGGYKLGGDGSSSFNTPSGIKVIPQDITIFKTLTLKLYKNGFQIPSSLKSFTVVTDVSLSADGKSLNVSKTDISIISSYVSVDNIVVGWGQNTKTETISVLSNTDPKCEYQETN